MNIQRFKSNFMSMLNLAGLGEEGVFAAKFYPNPVYDYKKINAVDDVVRLWALKDYSFDREHSFEEMSSLLCVVQPKFPLWVALSPVLKDGVWHIVVEFSMRFRKPSQLLNQEYGYPPFSL